MKASEMIRLIERDGWQLIRQTGSHRVYRPPFQKGICDFACSWIKGAAEGYRNVHPEAGRVVKC